MCIESKKRGGGNQKAVEVLRKANEARRFSNEKVFVENSTYQRHNLKARIINQNILPYICSICGVPPLWLEKPMPLILDHINGVSNDDRIENLRFVCSNCDSQLPTYKARNIKKKK